MFIEHTYNKHNMITTFNCFFFYQNNESGLNSISNLRRSKRKREQLGETMTNGSLKTAHKKKPQIAMEMKTGAKKDETKIHSDIMTKNNDNENHCTVTRSFANRSKLTNQVCTKL